LGKSGLDAGARQVLGRVLTEVFVSCRKMQSNLNKFVSNYSRRYIRTGSPAPIFHAMGIVFTIGIIAHAKGHYGRVHDPRYEGHH